MRNVLGLVLAVVIGCGHDSKPAVQPDEHPPLPPSSGTPIGFLVDDAAELKLSDDQLTRLKAIDAELSVHLDALDAQQRSSAPSGAGSASSAGAAGRHRGGRRGGGRRGGGAGAGSGSARPSGVAKADATGRATEQRAADVRDALARAFAMFDPTQQQIAKRVLEDHGVDVDAGRSVPAPAEGTEPDTGDEAGSGSGGS